MAKAQKPKLKDLPIIQPVIRTNGEPHIMETMFEGKEDLPIIKSVGYAPIRPGSMSWVSYTITTQGKEVLKIEVDEPNLKQIAEESAKIAFVSTFIDQEF